MRLARVCGSCFPNEGRGRAGELPAAAVAGGVGGLYGRPGIGIGGIGRGAAGVSATAGLAGGAGAAAVGAGAGAAAVTASARACGTIPFLFNANTALQRAQRAFTPSAGTFSGSIRKTAWH